MTRRYVTISLRRSVADAIVREAERRRVRISALCDALVGAMLDAAGAP